MKIVQLISMLLIITLGINAQSYNGEKTSFTKYLIRMYNDTPFEGVRIVDDYHNTYLISVLALDKNKYKTEAVLNRVASVKAMSQASRYINGANISQEMIIHINQHSNGNSDTDIFETIKESSFGNINSLELLSSFSRQDGFQVFIYSKKINKK